MKVLMTADTVGGVFTYALELMRALASRDVTFHLATQGRALSEDQREALAALPHVTVHESSYKLEWMEEPWADVERATAWLQGLEAELRPDVVHLNDYAHGAAGFSCPTLIVGHSCVASWWEAVRQEPLPPGWARYRDTVRRALARVDAVVAPSQAMLAALERHYGQLPHGSVVHNGRDASLFAPAQKEPLVLTAGRLWDEAKNVAALDAVAPRLPWQVCVAGEETQPSAGGGARRLGRLPLPQLAQWYARASLYVLPARYEPFGLSVLEAALSGCALVLGDIPSLRELWCNAALFVPPGDTAALEAAVRSLIEDGPQRARLADAARERARHFEPQRMATRYLALYRQLRAARPAAPTGVVA